MADLDVPDKFSVAIRVILLAEVSASGRPKEYSGHLKLQYVHGAP
jgi:hypothetical protein